MCDFLTRWSGSPPLCGINLWTLYWISTSTQKGELSARWPWRLVTPSLSLLSSSPFSSPLSLLSLSLVYQQCSLCIFLNAPCCLRWYHHPRRLQSVCEPGVNAAVFVGVGSLSKLLCMLARADTASVRCRCCRVCWRGLTVKAAVYVGAG